MLTKERYWTLLGARVLRGLTELEKQEMAEFEVAFPKEAKALQDRMFLDGEDWEDWLDWTDLGVRWVKCPHCGEEASGACAATQIICRHCHEIISVELDPPKKPWYKRLFQKK